MYKNANRINQWQDWWNRLAVNIKPTTNENYWTGWTSSNERSNGWRFEILEVYIAVKRHPKNHSLCKKAKRGGGQKAKAGKQLGVLGMQSKKQSFNWTRRTSANLTIPSMEQSSELREGLSQHQTIRESITDLAGLIVKWPWPMPQVDLSYLIIASITVSHCAY